jgi:enoyl-CoA hydratase
MAEDDRDAHQAVRCETRGHIAIVTIDRPEVRNAVDQATAQSLVEAFRRFEADDDLRVAILTGGHRHFCAGADLQAVAQGEEGRVTVTGEGPMGPTRMLLDKPVIAAIEGFAVAGGLELAIWCDLRVAGREAVLGVFCRRFGVPLVDLGTIRLPRLIGHGRALDLILTGRPVTADEALRIGLIDRITEPGKALEGALALAEEIAGMPQVCMRSDRLSAYEQWDMPIDDAIRNETMRGLQVLESGETQEGAARFAQGAGRHGRPVEDGADEGS